MIRILVGKIRQYLKLHQHRKKWRHDNAHNFTIASTFFPASKVKVGKYTYGDLHVISYGEENEGLEIGHYVSIATGVTFLLGGNHFYKRFTTYPFIQKFKDHNYVETWSKGKIIIEDDVWIGTNAFIMPGIKIGKGAIIGACAVVTKDVAAYAIVAGNPAKVVKSRFDKSEIDMANSIEFNTILPEFIMKNLDLYSKENDFSVIRNLIEGELIKSNERLHKGI